MRCSFYVFLLVMAVSFITQSQAATPWPKGFVQTDEELLEFIRDAGGSIGFKVGKACPTCMRGVFASRDYREGELIARIPLKTGIMLGHAGEWSLPGTLAEAHADPTFNETHGSFWASQPGPDGVFSMELFTEEHKALTHSPEIRTVVDNNNAQHKYQWERLIRRRPSLRVSLDQYLYYAGLSTSRAFSVYGYQDHTQSTEQWLVAAADLLNSWEPYNVRRDTTPHPRALAADGSPQFGFMELFAVTNLKEGEELVHTYGHTHRNDISLMVYGYVQALEPPLLCTIDMPGWSEDDPWKNTDEEDDTFYSGLGLEASKAELERLQARLASLPTTEAEDRAELAKMAADAKAAGKSVDWKKETIFKFRIERKRSISYRINKLKEQVAVLEDSEL